MNKLLPLTLFFVCLGFFSMAQQSYPAMDEMPLEEVLQLLETKNEVVFSYNNDKIANQYISIDPGTYTLQQILQNVFDQSQLKYEFIDNRYILLTSKKRQNQLDYLCGYLKDGITKEPIMFATVNNTSMTEFTETDTNGYFKIKVRDSDFFVEISFLGYEPYIIDLEKVTGDTCDMYFVRVETISFPTVVLKEYLTDGISQTDNGNTVIINPDEMDVLPGSVEKDVLSAISFLPGITTPGESLDGIHIRGGTPDQNLILWDGIPMYHTSHFFGTISAFNPNIIDHVNVLRSGIGSEFGGRVSSVIDIHSKEEITERFNLGAGFNLTHINLDLDIPLWKNSSLMISSRRSITDVWNTPTFVRYAEKVFQGTRLEEGNFNDPELQFSDEYKFNDANLKWMMDYGKNKFRFMSLGTLNSLNYKSDVEELNVISVEILNLQNAGANLSWERQWNDRYSSTLEITNAEYTFDYDLSFKGKGNNPDPIFSFVSNNSITDGGFNFDNEWKINENQKIDFGYQFTENKTNLDITSFNRQDTSVNQLDFENRLHALYGDYSLKMPNILQLDIGLRYLYQGVLQNNYFEPRIALATNVTDRLKLKVSTGKHFQFVSQLVAFNTNNLGLNNQFWVTANIDEDNKVTIPVIESNQWMGGFIYRRGNWTMDVEGYVKELAGITTFSSSFVELEDAPFSSGNSRIRGIDFLLKKRMKQYRTWISFSLSRTKYEFPALSAEPIIASHDQTHILKWVHLYQEGSWEVSLGIEYRSGLPTTEATLVDGEVVFGTPNGVRLPEYFRLDGSIIYNFGKPGELNGFVGFSLQNIGNRDNIIGRSYIPEDRNMGDPTSLLQISERGLKFTPNISVNLRLH
ncbi:MAG: TonB-dependent receptor [Bacteroidota bacterium]